MSRSTPLLLVLLGVVALGVLFIVADPLGLIAGKPGDETGSEGEDLVGTGPTLQGVEKPVAGRLPKHVGGEPVGVLQLALGSGTLKGRVTGAGEAILLARVEVILPPPFPAAAVRTKEEGAFEVRGLPPGTFDLRASSDGWLPRTVTAPALAETQVVEVPPIDLKRRTGAVDGLDVKVTDQLGRPIAGAKVLATTMTWSVDVMIGADESGTKAVHRRTATTNEKGLAELHGLPPEEYDVVATAPGYATMAVEGVQVGRGRVLPMTIRLGPGVSITGRVETADGKPLAGAYTFGLHQPTWAPCEGQKSRADGTFTLDGLREGTYMLFAGDEKHGTAELNRIPAPSSGHVIKLKGAGTLRGRVTTAAGKPVAQFQLRPAASRPFGYEYSHVVQVSHAEGRFETMVPPGSYELRVTTDTGDYGRAEGVQVKAGETTEADIVLGTTGSVRGVVTDPAGNHLEGAEVYVNLGGMPGGPSREHYARSDADGRFEVEGLALEQVTLHARHAAWADTKWEGRVVQGGPEITLKMSGGGRIEGRILMPDGSGAAGEQVNLYQGWFESRTAFCDGNGAYVFERVAPGKWNLSTGRFEQGASGLGKSGIVVTADATSTVDLAYTAGEGSVTGVVRTAGQPVVEASVYLSDNMGAVQTLVTDAQGRFQVVGLALGRVEIHIEAKDGLMANRNVRLTKEAPTSEVTVDFGTAGVRGRCVDPEGTAITSAWITLERHVTGGGQPAFAGSRAVGADGTFELKGLDAGTYHMRVWAGGYAQLLTDPFVLAAEESKDLGYVRLQRGGDLSGRVTDDEGKPVEDATLALHDAAGRPVFSFSLFTTGSDGRYTVQGVVAGRYTVRAEARGLAPAERAVDVGEGGATADLVLTRGGAVQVLVVDAQEKPIDGARVFLTDSTGKPVTRTLSLVNFFDSGRDRTNAQGEATIPDLASGSYRVRAQQGELVLAGDEPTAVVSPGGTTRVTVQLVAPAR